MSEWAVRARISGFENRIAQLQAEIREAEGKIGRLSDLRGALASYKDEMGGRVNSGIAKVASIAGLGNAARSVASYAEGMRALLTGGRYARALGGLDDARAQALRAIRDLEREIERKQAEIRSLNASIDSCHRDLRRMAEERAARERVERARSARGR